MPKSSIVKVKQNSTIDVLDGTTPAALVLAALLYDGDFACDDLVYANESIVITANGVFLGVAKGNYKPITGSFTFLYTGQVSADANNPASPLDFVQATNGYAAAVNTQTGYNQQLRGLRFTAEGTDFGDSADHIIVFSKCEIRFSLQAGEPNRWTCDFVCHGGYTRS